MLHKLPALQSVWENYKQIFIIPTANKPELKMIKPQNVNLTGKASALAQLLVALLYLCVNILDKRFS